MRKLARAGLIVLVNGAVLLVLLVLAELGLRIHREGFRPAIATLVASSGVPYSNLGTFNWVIYDQELGYRLNPHQKDINNLSMRHGEITIPKPPGVFRIVVLGDSIPYSKSGFVTHLRTRLVDQRPYEVVNASVPGYTSYQELLFFKRYASRTEPDLVIWTYCLNDNHKFLHRFDEQAQMLMTREAEESLKIHSAWDRVVSRSYFLSLLRVTFAASKRREAEQLSRYPWEGAVDFNIAWKEDSWTFYEEHLKEMAALTKASGQKLAILIVPYEPQLQYRRSPTDHENAVKPQRILLGLCKRHGVPCLDLLPPFSERYDRGEKLYRDGIHLNDAGHRLTASLLERFLTENHLLKSKNTSDG